MSHLSNWSFFTFLSSNETSSSSLYYPHKTFFSTKLKLLKKNKNWNYFQSICHWLRSKQNRKRLPSKNFDSSKVLNSINPTSSIVFSSPKNLQCSTSVPITNRHFGTITVLTYKVLDVTSKIWRLSLSIIPINPHCSNFVCLEKNHIENVNIFYSMFLSKQKYI